MAQWNGRKRLPLVLLMFVVLIILTVPEILGYSPRLRNGKMFKVKLGLNKPRTFYYPMDRTNPFWLYVTPCGGTVKWKLSVLTPIDDDSTTNDDNDHYYSRQQNASIRNGGGLDENDFNQVRSSDDQKYPRNNENRHKRRRRPNQYELSTNNVMESPDRHQHFDFQEEQLVQEVGWERMKYVNENGIQPGIIRLHFLAPYLDTWVELFATTELIRLQTYYPKLPPHPREAWVNLVNVTSHSASFEWHHTPSNNWWGDRNIDYCLGLSPYNTHYSFCHLTNDIYNHNLRRERSQSSSSGSSSSSNSDKNKNRPFQNKKSNHLYPDGNNNNMIYKHPNSPASARPRSPYIVYTKNQNSFTFNNLEANRTYHVNLFVVNKLTNGSSAYVGTSFVTPSAQERLTERRLVSLADGVLLSAYLNPARTAHHVYEFRVQKFHRRLVIIVQPCGGGYIRAHILKDHHRTLQPSIAVSQLKRFIIRYVQPGFIRIKIVNDDNQPKVFKIWASTQFRKDPFPHLPEDSSLKILENSRSCSSLSLAWLPSKDTIRYCLYRRLEPDDYFKRLILEEFDQCRGPEHDSERVECQTHRFALYDSFGRNSSGSGEKSIYESKVSGLQHGRMYRFDLIAETIFPDQNQKLSYRTLWVKTRNQC